ncbi:MAG: phosphate acyltransferase PlsX [Parcubacteria group bacterium]
MPRIWIAVDAMGGDQYPDVPVEGAIRALSELKGDDFGVVLVGDELVIRPSLNRLKYDSSRVCIQHAPQVIGMDEKPSSVVRGKRGSSIHVGLGMQPTNASAFISAGNTGAVCGVALTMLKCIPGVERPAIAVTFLSPTGDRVILDAGAMVDSTPIQLVQSGIMGVIYAEHVRGISEPTIGLVSIGEEDTKGNAAVIAANELFRSLRSNGHIRFFGNIEGGDVLTGRASVIVCDGFVGNIILKMLESILPALKLIISATIRRGSLAQQGFAVASKFLLSPTIGSIRRAFDVEQYGGAPLLGVNGVVIIAHGSSTPTAIVNAVDNARMAVLHQVNTKIQMHIEQYATVFNPPGP